MIGNKSKLEKWLGIPSELTAYVKGLKPQSTTGNIKYGIRIPCASGMTPLKEVELGSKERVNRERPDYWFVNGEQSIKVRLFTARVRDNEITGYGIDSGIFKYKITRLNQTE